MNPALNTNYLVNTDPELEALVLGSVLNQPRLTSDLLRIIRKGAVFYTQPNQLVYQAINEIYGKGETVDLLTVNAWLKKGGHADAVSFDYLADLSANQYAVSIEAHCLILFELAIKRFLGVYGTKLARAANDPTSDALGLLDKVNSDVDEILGNIAAIGEKSTHDYLKQVFTDIEEKKAGRLRGLTLGIQEVDERTGGFRGGNYVILAGGTGMGKTGVLTHIIRHQCLEEKNHVGLFSLEMTGAEIMERLLAAESDYSNSEISRAKDLDWNVLNNRSGRLVSMNTLHIHDRPVQATELQFKIREWVRRYGIKVVMIDYLQLVRDSRYKSAQERVSNLSMDLKSIAQELNIVVIAVSQLSRAFESRKDLDKRPMKSDLRESGQLEQDANAILMLFRPHNYGLQYHDGSVTEYTMELHGVKFRGAKITERDNPWLFDYDGACNRIARFGTMQHRQFPGQLALRPFPDVETTF